MKKLLIFSILFLCLVNTMLFSQDEQKQPILRKQFYYMNNSSPYPEEVLTALYKVFDNKKFDAERPKMTTAQANLILWNAVANITSYTNPLNQLIRYKDHEEEIINVYNQMGYSTENQECIRMLFMSAKEADSLQQTQYTWQSPNCFYSNSFDTLITKYIETHLNDLVRDENGAPINQRYTGEYLYYDKANSNYVKLNMNKGHKVTAVYYNDDLKLQKLDWFYPSGTVRYHSVFSETGKKSYETYFYPQTETTKREIIYNEEGIYSSIVDYNENGNVIEEKYYSPTGLLELSYAVVKLKDGSSIYAPVVSLSPDGKSTYADGNGIVEIYTYEKENRKLLMRQEFKNYQLDGKVIELDPKKGKVEKVFKAGEIENMHEYYTSGELKRETIFENGEISNVKNYPKYKSYQIIIERINPEENRFSIQNTETYEETKADQYLECLNCKEILADIFSKTWVNANPDLFEQESYEYSLMLRVNEAKEVSDINLYQWNDSNSYNKETFQAQAESKLKQISFKNFPKLDAQHMLTMTDRFKVTIVKAD